LIPEEQNGVGWGRLLADIFMRLTWLHIENNGSG